MRERMRSRVTTIRKGKTIEIDLRHDLPGGFYDLPLTLKTYVPAGWPAVEVKQGNRTTSLRPARDVRGRFVLYQAVPNAGLVTLTKRSD
jgi:hypothetical protein